MIVRVKLYSDGGARGNPGLAAGAYLILNEEDEVILSGSIFLGKRTNNQAEYEALIAGLKAASSLNVGEVQCFLDSELVCRQLTGQYKVKNQDLSLLWKKVKDLARSFSKVSFFNVPRTDLFIQRADRLVNEKLDLI
ncbi:MAG: ribonuclease HI family protein [Crenarchaeota archaeon]|nr:ribonuclease HI family protein [Thermoproteota archaeon]